MKTSALVLWSSLTSLVFSTVSLPAAIRVKANNSDALNLASSWTNNLVPVGIDVAQFDSVVVGPLSLALGADTGWNQIMFINPGGDITIAAGNSLTLSNNTPIAFGAGAANLTLNCDITCAGAGFATLPTAPAGRSITYGGVIIGRSAAIALGNTTGTLLLNGALTTQIGTSVQVNTTGPKLGIGASSIGNPPVSGPLGTNLFIWNSTSGTELFATNGAQTLANPIRIAASPMLFNSTADLTFAGLADLNNGTRTIAVSNVGTLRFTGTFSNATGLVKIGSGVLALGGTNTSVAWANDLSILGGTVRLLTNDFFPDGETLLRMTNTAHVLDMNGFSDRIAGVAGSGIGDWVGTVDNTAPGTTSTLTLGDNFQYVIAGNLQNTGLGSKLALVKVGTGGLILTNSRSFSGGITNASRSEIFINSPGAAGTGPITLTVNDAELVYNGGGSITWTNDIVLQATAVISAADNSTLEIAGVISGPGAFMRTNTLFQQGLLNFSAANTFTGEFVLFGGSVMLSHPRATGAGLFTIGHPTFTSGSIIILPGTNLSGANAVTNSVLVNRDFTVGGTNLIDFAGPMVWITNATQRSINVTNPAGALISGLVSGYGFNKTGQGLLTFNGLCTHNGPSTLSVGPMAFGPSAVFTGSTTFLIGGSGRLDVSALIAGFIVAPNQTLSGSGSVKGNVTVNGTFLPADVISTFTFSNNLTLGVGSTTVVRVSRNFQTIEKAVCLGTLTYGGTLMVSNVGSALLLGDSFDLFGFTNSPGSFASLNLPPLNAGLIWDTSTLSVDGKIRVVSASTGPQLSNPAWLNPSNFAMTVTGGTTNGLFRVLSQTNLLIPLVNWQILSTNTFDGSGNLTVTNAINPADSQRYFRAIQP